MEAGSSRSPCSAMPALAAAVCSPAGLGHELQQPPHISSEQMPKREAEGKIAGICRDWREIFFFFEGGVLKGPKSFLLLS